MKLSEVSIRRPVFATVLSLLVVLIGLVSFTKLSVREYPKIDEPVVTVSVRYVRRVGRGDGVTGYQAAWKIRLPALTRWTSSPPSAAPNKRRSSDSFST
jgi:hypothetical protein